MNGELLTVSQAATYLKVCDKTVRRLISKNALAASKVGKSWRIKEIDIYDYLKNNQNRGGYNE